MKTVDEFELTATTGATILPEDNGMAEEPSTSARHTGVSVLTVPTNRVEFTDHSNVMAESPMAGTSSRTLVNLRSPAVGRATVATYTRPSTIKAACTPVGDNRNTDMSPWFSPNSEVSTSV